METAAEGRSEYDPGKPFFQQCLEIAGVYLSELPTQSIEQTEAAILEYEAREQ